MATRFEVDNTNTTQPNLSSTGTLLLENVQAKLDEQDYTVITGVFGGLLILDTPTRPNQRADFDSAFDTFLTAQTDGRGDTVTVIDAGGVTVQIVLRHVKGHLTDSSGTCYIDDVQVHLDDPAEIATFVSAYDAHVTNHR